MEESDGNRRREMMKGKKKGKKRRRGKGQKNEWIKKGMAEREKKR